MQEQPPQSDTSNLRQWFSILLMVAVSTAAMLYIGKHLGALETTLAQLGLLGPGISIVLQTIFGASPIPTEPLTMVNGAVFGPWWGAFYSWLGYMFASLVEYFIGARVGEAANFDDWHRRLPKFMRRFPADSPWFLILGRCIPGYGAKLVGLVGGVYKISVWRFTWTAAIPNALGALAFAAGGFRLRALLLH